MRAGVEAWARDRGWELLLEKTTHDPAGAARLPVRHRPLRQRHHAGARARRGGRSSGTTVRRPTTSSGCPVSSRSRARRAVTRRCWRRAAAEFGAERIAVARGPRPLRRSLAREGLDARSVETASRRAEARLRAPLRARRVGGRAVPRAARRGVLLGGVSPGLPHRALARRDARTGAVASRPRRARRRRGLRRRPGVRRRPDRRALPRPPPTGRCRAEPVDRDVLRRLRARRDGLQVGHRLSVVRVAVAVELYSPMRPESRRGSSLV